MRVGCRNDGEAGPRIALERSSIRGDEARSFLIVQREPRASGRPIGRLPGGEPYFAPIGEMRYDGDRVQCHLCGRWLKMVGGSHLVSAHGIAIGEYREM